MLAGGLSRYVKGIHHAWVTLAIAIAMRLVSSVERTASGVLVAYMVDPAGEFGWSRSVVGLALSLQWIFSGVFGPPAGWLGDMYGLRRTMAVGALLFMATSVLIGLVTVPWQFILYFGILMSASLAIFQVPLVTAVTVWFQKHLGVATGMLTFLRSLGSALGVAVLGAIALGYGVPLGAEAGGLKVNHVADPFPFAVLFYVLAAMMLAAAVINVLMPHKPLRGRAEVPAAALAE